MPDIDAFILPPRNPATATIRLGGRSLCERAILALRRGGIERIAVSGECTMGVGALRRLAHAGIALLTREAAMTSTTEGRQLVVVSSDVLFEPAAVNAIVSKLSSKQMAAVAASEASPGTFVALRPDAAARLRRGASDRDILDRLDAIRVTSLGGEFCRAIMGRGDAAAVEHSYTSHIHRVDHFTIKLTRFATLPFRRAWLRLRAAVTR